MNAEGSKCKDPASADGVTVAPAIPADANRPQGTLRLHPPSNGRISDVTVRLCDYEIGLGCKRSAAHSEMERNGTSKIEQTYHEILIRHALHSVLHMPRTN